MLSRRRFIQSLMVAPTGVGLLSACEPLQPLKIALHPWIGYETLYLAEELGKLPPSVQLVKFGNNSEKMPPLISGTLDGGAFTLDEVLLLRSKGIPLTIVALLDISAGADVVMVKNEQQQPLIQVGQRIGYESNQLGQLMLDLLLLHQGLSRDDIKPYAIPVGDSQIEAWQRGSVDVMISYEPTASKLKRLGARVALSSRDFPQRIFDVIAIRSDRIAQQASTVKALLLTHFDMLQRIQQQPEDSLYRIASRQHISYEEAKTALHGVILPSLSRNHQLLGQQQGNFQQAIVHLQQIMKLSSQTTISQQPLYTTQYLPGVLI